MIVLPLRLRDLVGVVDVIEVGLIKYIGGGV